MVQLFSRVLAEDGYAGVEIRVTPLRTEIIIKATRTQDILGEKGQRIRELTSVVQKRWAVSYLSHVPLILLYPLADLTSRRVVSIFSQSVLPTVVSVPRPRRSLSSTSCWETSPSVALAMVFSAS